MTCISCKQNLELRLKVAMKVESLERWINNIRELAVAQKKDSSLWVVRETVSRNGVITTHPTTIMEGRLHSAIRKLHGLIDTKI